MRKNAIPFTETNNPGSIEKNVCEKMDALTRVPMEKDLAEIYIRLVFVQQQKQAIKPMPGEQKPQLLLIIESRLKHCFTFTIKDPLLILFLCALTQRPGIAIMYLWYLQYWCFKNNVQDLDLTIFGEKVFPIGFFDEKDLHEIWNGQKLTDRPAGAMDNLVDYASAGKSIQFETKITVNNDIQLL